MKAPRRHRQGSQLGLHSGSGYDSQSPSNTDPCITILVSLGDYGTFVDYYCNENWTICQMRPESTIWIVPIEQIFLTRKMACSADCIDYGRRALIAGELEAERLFPMRQRLWRSALLPVMSCFYGQHKQNVHHRGWTLLVLQQQLPMRTWQGLLTWPFRRGTPLLADPVLMLYAVCSMLTGSQLPGANFKCLCLAR